MQIILQNSEETTLPKDFEYSEVVDLNLRSSQIENINGEFPLLKTLDLRKTANLKSVDIIAPHLQTVFLTGCGVENLSIESQKLVDINIKLAGNLKSVNLKTPSLEHIELQTEKSEEFVLNQLQNFPNLKGLNHIYKEKSRPLSKFVREFKIIEDEVHTHKKESRGDCSCSLCKSFGK